MKHYLIRHPRILSPHCNRCVGQTDLTLSECSGEALDRWQLEAATVSPRSIVSSDLRRCSEPAKALAASLNVPLSIDGRWRELDFGMWENRYWNEIYQEDPSRFDRWALNFLSQSPPHGECFDELRRRVVEAFNEAIEAFGAPVLIVTHASPIRAVLGQVGELSIEESFLWHVPHGAPIRIEVPDNAEVAGGQESETGLPCRAPSAV